MTLLDLAVDAITESSTALRTCKCASFDDCPHLTKLREVERWAEDEGLLEQARAIWKANS